MSPIQIFRAVLASFSDGKTFNPSYFMTRAEQPSESEDKPNALAPPPAGFQGSSEVVFVETTGWLNIACHLSRSSLIQVCILFLPIRTKCLIRQDICARHGKPCQNMERHCQVLIVGDLSLSRMFYDMDFLHFVRVSYGKACR